MPPMPVIPAIENQTKIPFAAKTLSSVRKMNETNDVQSMQEHFEDKSRTAGFKNDKNNKNHVPSDLEIEEDDDNRFNILNGFRKEYGGGNFQKGGFKKEYGGGNFQRERGGEYNQLGGYNKYNNSGQGGRETGVCAIGTVVNQCYEKFNSSTNFEKDFDEDNDEDNSTNNLSSGNTNFYIYTAK
ncbi:hypothetical protein KQX54_006282 [Cotesia glomerata]|uniref:Uncharacterized protein n=1 Tax=Cotesia glomerata TaxID=32391 RepID=A0AAV7IL67_COTGL|nr:hypothetical protein KQX54_006282 [Cotesia glomerata]